MFNQVGTQHFEKGAYQGTVCKTTPTFNDDTHFSVY